MGGPGATGHMSAPIDKNTTPRSPTSPATTPGGAQPAPDVGAMVRRVTAHLYMIIITLVIGGLATAQTVRTRKASYRSETVISFREGIGKSVAGSTEGTEILRSLASKLKETLLAQQTLRRIIDEYHLYPEVMKSGGYSSAVDIMRKKTDFKARAADTFAISFEGTDAEVAQKVCARMADILVIENSKRWRDDNRITSEFLDIERKRAAEDLSAIDREMSAFVVAHPEFVDGTAGLIGVGIEVRSRKNAERTGGSGGVGRRRAARGATDSVDPAATAAVDPVLLAARTRAANDLMDAKRDLNDKSNRFTEAHPDVRAARGRVAAAEVDLARAQEALAAAAPAAPEKKPAPVSDDPYGEAPVATAPAAGGAPQDKPAPPPEPPAPRSEPGSHGVSLEAEWARLNRALQQAKMHHDDIANKLFKAEMVLTTNESGYGASISVIDPAFKPSGPSNAPNKTVVMMGLAASIGVGVVLSAAVGLFLDDRVFSPSEVEPIVMVPVIGAVPKPKRLDKKGNGKGKGDKGSLWQRIKARFLARRRGVRD